jgi:1-aminocyclopropane-1-carboxylate deaminase
MLHSRIHPLKFINKPDSVVYIKREDELGFGIGGTKLRKYQTLLAYIKQHGIEHAALTGGAYSNNIVGLTQLLIERGVKPYLFLRGDQAPFYQGNFLLTALLVPKNKIHWVPRAVWKEVNARAQAFLETLPSQNTLLIPEGACMSAALPGALTLGEDILQSEQEHQLAFEHIFIEAGTGLAAIGLILGLANLGRKVQVHILLLAISQIEFIAKLRLFYHQLDSSVMQSINWKQLAGTLHFYKPTTASSFGAINRQIFDTIIQVARQDGMITDPIYTAKLLYMAKKIILESPSIQGSILIIHGGGGLGLMGYQEQLEKQLKKWDAWA